MINERSEIRKRVAFLARKLATPRGIEPLSASRVLNSSLPDVIKDWLGPTQPTVSWSVDRYPGGLNVRLALASDPRAERKLSVFGAIVPGATGFLNVVALPEMMWMFNNRRTDVREVYPIEEFLGRFGAFPTALRLVELTR